MLDQTEFIRCHTLISNSGIFVQTGLMHSCQLSCFWRDSPDFDSCPATVPDSQGLISTRQAKVKKCNFYDVIASVVSKCHLNKTGVLYHS